MAGFVKVTVSLNLRSQTEYMMHPDWRAYEALRFEDGSYRLVGSLGQHFLTGLCHGADETGMTGMFSDHPPMNWRGEWNAGRMFFIPSGVKLKV